MNSLRSGTTMLAMAMSLSTVAHANEDYRSLVGVKHMIAHIDLVEIAREAGVPVLSREEGESTNVLAVRIGGTSHRLGAKIWEAHTTELVLYQSVRLSRDPSIEIVIPTWRMSFVHPGKGTVEERAQEIEHLVKLFSEDLRSANSPGP